MGRNPDDVFKLTFDVSALQTSLNEAYAAVDAFALKAHTRLQSVASAFSASLSTNTPLISTEFEKIGTVGGTSFNASLSGAILEGLQPLLTRLDALLSSGMARVGAKAGKVAAVAMQTEMQGAAATVGVPWQMERPYTGGLSPAYIAQMLEERARNAARQFTLVPESPAGPAPGSLAAKQAAVAQQVRAWQLETAMPAYRETLTPMPRTGVLLPEVPRPSVSGTIDVAAVQAARERALLSPVTSVGYGAPFLANVMGAGQPGGVGPTIEAQKRLETAVKNQGLEVQKTKGFWKTFQDTLADNKSIFRLEYQLRQLENIFRETAMTGAVVVAGVGMAFEHLATQASEYGIEVRRLAELMHTSGTEASVWLSTFKLLNIETNTGMMALKMFQKRLGDAERGIGAAAKSFRDLGVSFREGNSEEILHKVFVALEKTGNETLRNSTAANLFGRQYQELLPFIMAGAAGVTSFGEAADRMGLKLDAGVIKRLQAVQVQTQEARGAWEGLGLQWGLSLAPMITDFVKMLEGWVQWAKENQTLVAGIERLALTIGKGGLLAVAIGGAAALVTGLVKGFVVLGGVIDVVTKSILAMSGAEALTATRWATGLKGLAIGGIASSVLGMVGLPMGTALGLGGVAGVAGGLAGAGRTAGVGGAGTSERFEGVDFQSAGFKTSKSFVDGLISGAPMVLAAGGTIIGLLIEAWEKGAIEQSRQIVEASKMDVLKNKVLRAQKAGASIEDLLTLAGGNKDAVQALLYANKQEMKTLLTGSETVTRAQEPGIPMFPLPEGLTESSLAKRVRQLHMQRPLLEKILTAVMSKEVTDKEKTTEKPLQKYRLATDLEFLAQDRTLLDNAVLTRKRYLHDVQVLLDQEVKDVHGTAANRVAILDRANKDLADAFTRDEAIRTRHNERMAEQIKMQFATARGMEAGRALAQYQAVQNAGGAPEEQRRQLGGLGMADTLTSDALALEETIANRSLAASAQAGDQGAAAGHILDLTRQMQMMRQEATRAQAQVAKQKLAPDSAERTTALTEALNAETDALTKVQTLQATRQAAEDTYNKTAAEGKLKLADLDRQITTQTLALTQKTHDAKIAAEVDLNKQLRSVRGEAHAALLEQLKDEVKKYEEAGVAKEKIEELLAAKKQKLMGEERLQAIEFLAQRGQATQQMLDEELKHWQRVYAAEKELSPKAIEAAKNIEQITQSQQRLKGGGALGSFGSAEEIDKQIEAITAKGFMTMEEESQVRALESAKAALPRAAQANLGEGRALSKPLPAAPAGGYGGETAEATTTAQTFDAASKYLGDTYMSATSPLVTALNDLTHSLGGNITGQLAPLVTAANTPNAAVLNNASVTNQTSHTSNNTITITTNGQSQTIQTGNTQIDAAARALVEIVNRVKGAAPTPSPTSERFAAPSRDEFLRNQQRAAAMNAGQADPGRYAPGTNPAFYPQGPDIGGDHILPYSGERIAAPSLEWGQH